MGGVESYFEWLGAGVYSPLQRGGAMHGRVFYLKELRYGFEEERFVVRVECFPDSLAELEDPEFRIVVGAAEELTVVVKLERGRMKEFAVEMNRVCLLKPATIAVAAFQRTLEVAIWKNSLNLKGLTKLKLGVALWHGGLPDRCDAGRGRCRSAVGGRECSLGGGVGGVVGESLESDGPPEIFGGLFLWEGEGEMGGGELGEWKARWWDRRGIPHFADSIRNDVVVCLSACFGYWEMWEWGG